MMIDVFPFLVSATKKEDFRELVLPDFLGKDDRYAFSRITPGHGRTNDTIYSRRVKLQDGSDWRVFQNSFQTDSLDHVGRNIPRIEGFFVRESSADRVEISKETFAEIKAKLTEHFLAAQKWDRGHPTTVLSEPWQLKPGHQEAVKVLPALDIRQEVDAFHARPEAQKESTPLTTLNNGKIEVLCNFLRCPLVRLGAALAVVALAVWVVTKIIKEEGDAPREVPLGDGRGDALEPAPDADGRGGALEPAPDADGRGDALEPAPDADGRGDALEPAPDADGRGDALEPAPDAD